MGLRSQRKMICLVLIVFASLLHTGWTTGENERTMLAVKPDGVQRRLVGEIIQRLERKGFKLVVLKMMQASKALIEEHYQEHENETFFPDLIKYMTSGPVVAMVWQGQGVVKTTRAMIGQPRPADSSPGTIRGDYAIDRCRNVIHGSDSVESAEREIKIWFLEKDILSWDDCSRDWIYD